MPETLAVAQLPARSQTVALAERLAPSPVTVLAAGQAPASPDSISEQVHWTTTSPLYQPLPFGAVVAVPLRLGAVLSTLMPATVAMALLPAASTAVPVADWPAPSPSVCGAVQVSMPESASAQVKVTVTSVFCQPLLLADGDWLPLIVGAVLST